MRRPGAGVGRRMCFRGIGIGGGPSGPDYLLNYADGTHSRASAATHWDGTILTRYASGVPRILADGSYVSEGSRTNYLLYSHDISAQWTFVGGGTIGATADTLTAPDGTALSADEVTWPASASANATMLTPALPTGKVAHSVFYKRTNTAWSARLPGFSCRGWSGTYASQDFSDDTAAWAHECFSADSTGVSTPEFRLRNNLATERTGGIWGAQSEAGAFPSSHIETAGAAATRAADDMVLASGLVPASIYAGGWTLQVTMDDASAAEWIAAGNIGYVYYRDANNYLRLNADGKWSLAIAGNIATQTTAGTWARGDVVTLSVDIPSGDLMTSGAGNDGTFSTTGGTWGSGALEIGQSGAGANSIFSAIGRPGAL